jgi:hypothetical protein
MASDYDLQ